MSEEHLKAFLEKVQGDTNLQEKLKAATDSDAVLAIAKEAGFSISADDLKNAQLKVSDEELEEATGGMVGGITALQWFTDPEYRQQVRRQARAINNPSTFKTDGCWDGVGG